MSANNDKRGCSLEQIEKIRKLYPKKERLLAAGEYYIHQLDHSSIDPAAWPEDVLQRAVDVFEVIASILCDELEVLKSKPAYRLEEVQKIAQVKSEHDRFQSAFKETQYLLGRSS